MEPSYDGSSEGVRGTRAEDDSTSASSCVSEAQEIDEDIQILRLLDAVDRFLLCRDSLGTLLSQGWMEIASARYSMGPSRIDQALFSLKPCPASMRVTVSTSENLSKSAGQTKEGEELYNFRQDCRFSLSHNNASISSQNLSASSDALPKFQLRQRHSSGTQHTSSNRLDDREGDTTQDVHKTKTSDSLAWFGALVSPHLRRAQSSFNDALEIIGEMANVQSTILTAYQKIKEINGLPCEEMEDFNAQS